MFLYGSKMVGSDSQLTSVAEEEILSSSVVNIDLLNVQACHISINGGDYVYIPAGIGIRTNMYDYIVNSVKIQESGVSFTWVATLR